LKKAVKSVYALGESMNKSELIENIKREKLIVIVRGVLRDDLPALADALYSGGVRLMEITFDKSGKTPPHMTAENIRILKEHTRGRMHIGAGTVTTPEEVELVADAGGEFIISPDTCEEVIRRTVELGLVSIPGALTPTEAASAHRFGADFVKLFPVEGLGVSYVKAIRAPLSQISFLAVGGVDLDNIRDYMNTGISGVGIGSAIIDKELIRRGEFEKITALAREYVEALGG
jgi:2-dehydro-3-deoxyphosphogluconate aldolase/(4S)-4-hydroxy-2-oxoglutarate aldolase